MSSRLYEFLKEISRKKYPNEVTFLTSAVPELLVILGYDKSHLFFEASIGKELRRRADAIVSASRTDAPWLLIETKVPRIAVRKFWGVWEEQLYAYKAMANPEYAVLFSPQLLLILFKDQRKRYELDTLTLEQAKVIKIRQS
jgi:hypothetical protein